MVRKLAIVSLLLTPASMADLMAQWEPPTRLAKEEIIEISEQLLGQSDIPFDVKEDIIRINVLRMDWDVGGAVYTPQDPSRIVVGADGKLYPSRKKKGKKKKAKQPKNGAVKTDLTVKQAAWKTYGQLCRLLSQLNLDDQLLSEMDAIGEAIKSVR